MSLSIGLGGVNRHACAAVTDGMRVLGVCEQERVTRVRGAGSNPTGVPDEALDAILTDARARRSDITHCGLAEATAVIVPWTTVVVDHHYAHACAAYLTSPFSNATVVICDHERPGVSVWHGQDGELAQLEWHWTGPHLSDLYTECARILGFASQAGDQRFEALARMMATDADDRIPTLFTFDGAGIREAENWRALVADRVAAGDISARARVAAALQDQIASVLVAFLKAVREQTAAAGLCVGGNLFHHSAINSAVRQSGLFERVFVPANPGNAGMSVGTAMHVSGMRPSSLSAFMGPATDADVIKRTLDNCKLRYDWLDEGGLIQAAVHHLQRGRLVGWFEGRMEWGPRALGARSILASPFSPYVLENLNLFLKRREAWRGYALSTLAESADEHFIGPAEAPYMECDYQPRNVERFRPAMPASASRVRVHTVGADGAAAFPRGAFSVRQGIGCSLPRQHVVQRVPRTDRLHTARRRARFLSALGWTC